MPTYKTARRENALNRPLWDKLVTFATKNHEPKGEWTRNKGAWVSQEYKKKGGTYRAKATPSSGLTGSGNAKERPSGGGLAKLGKSGLTPGQMLCALARKLSRNGGLS